MKDIETIIKAHLNDLAKAMEQKALDADSERWHKLFEQLNGACDLAKILGYTTNYDPLTNTFTVSKED